LDKHTALQKYYGYTAFRPGQEEIIDHILAGRDVLGVMPTGAGKSLCYQLPAILSGGTSIVISPLISLMKDQVNALSESGIPAAYLNSSLTPAQQGTVVSRAIQGAYQIIYVAPERLETDGLAAIASAVSIRMVTVDEAHCISQWGQDFRPSYLKIAGFISRLRTRPAVSAFTATATPTVREDITAMLGLRDPFTLTTGFNRENLYFEVRRPRKKLDELLGYLRQNREKSGIIYCATRKTVEDVCASLIENGFSATYYHAGMEDDARNRSQDDFQYDRKPVMVATNAFGMGIDKSNVSYVIHYNMPKSIESYYQEAGRAGRDGERADCILFYAKKDVQTNRFLIEKAGEQAEEAQRPHIVAYNLELLKHMTYYCTTSECLRAYIIKYFGEQIGPHCGNCGNCLTRFEEVDATVDAQKILSCVYRMERMGRSYGKAMIAQVLRGGKSERLLRLKLDRLSTYGVMHDVSTGKIIHIIDFLIEQGYLAVSEGEYPVVHTTPRTAAVIREGTKILMKLPREKEVQKAVQAVAQGAADPSLLAALRQKRSELAAIAHVPAYVIFTDASLRDICEKLPLSKEEFRCISGVGDVKLKKYAEPFLDIIRQFATPDLVLSDEGEPLVSYPRGLALEGARWTEEEDEQLRQEHALGFTTWQIGDIHSRTADEIHARLRKLGL